MSRRGYLILGILFLALLGYLAWPEGDAGASTYDLLEQRPGGGFVLRSSELEQELRGERVTINGVERPVDPERVQRLWRILEHLASTHPPIAPSGGLEAYGLGESATRLTASGVDLRWGRKGETSWVFDAGERLLYRFPAEVFAALDAASERLDRRSLLVLDRGAEALRVGEQHLVAERGAGGQVVGWRYHQAPDRPPASGRVARLFERLDRLELSTFSGELPATARPVLAIAIESEQQVQDLTLHRDGDRAWIAVAGLPPQPLEHRSVEALQQAADELAEDRLFDLPVSPAASPVGRIEVRRGSELVFEAERGELGDTTAADESSWELSWSGGRETASADVGQRFLAAVLGLPVTDASARPTVLSDPPPADDQTVTLRLGGHMPDGGLWLQIDGDRLGSPGFVARARALPELLRDLRPGSALSRELLRKPPARISKLQRARITPEGVQAEVLRRDRGGWVLVRAAGDPAAPELEPAVSLGEAPVRRLLTALIMAEAATVELAGPEDLTIREDPNRRELAVRIDPMTIDKASDMDRIEETAIQDWGLALRPLAAGGWEAIDFDGTFRYRLDDELVAEWFADLRSRAVLAAQPSRVRRVAVTPSAGRPFDLQRSGQDWELVLTDDRRFPADATSVRAYLGTLARLEAQSVDPDGLPLAPEGSNSGMLEIGMPGFGGTPDVIRLVVGPVEGGSAAASTGSGRMRLDADVLPALFPVVGTFLSPEDLQRLESDPDA